MSNSVSSGINAGTSGKSDTSKTPHVPGAAPAQQQFQRGTMGMLDDARQMAENAAGQGMQLNPMIYQMLGINPQFEDHSADLQSSQQEMDAAQQQFDEAQKHFDQLKGIPQGKRSKQQKQQIRQLKKQMPQMTKALADAKNQFQQVQTMPKTITGFNRMDPNQIDKSSPFSAQNPLNQAQATETSRLNQYLQGGEVDPTLKHQYDAAEQQLRAQLTQRFGPDFESSSVGQMALQNFSRQKNEAFATWNQQQVQKYNDLAFQGQANLQQLLAGQIGLMREPTGNQMNSATQLTNDAQTRLQEEQIKNQMRLGRAGVTVNTASGNPLALAGGGLQGIGQLLKTPYNQQGDTLGGAMTGGNAAQPTTVQVPSYGQQSALTSWASNPGAVAAYNTGGYTGAGGLADFVGM
jgi:hypothetical protein